MSSCIVEYKCINRILTAINANEKEGIKCDLDKFGRKLLKLNIEAIEQRYSYNLYMDGEEKREYIKGYKFEPVEIKPIQALKSLSCWIYQCSEGNIPKRKLYKRMDMARLYLAMDIIHNSKEWDDAEWG